MRAVSAALFLLILLLAACSPPEATMPCAACVVGMTPAPVVIGTAYTIPGDGGGSQLQVTARVRNPTTTAILVMQCPLVVRVIPIPPGSYDPTPEDACPAGTPAHAMYSGDTYSMTRLLRADALDSLAPGQYRVSVNVTFRALDGPGDNSVEASSAGVIQLPF